MTALLVWLLSALSALLFFIAGYLLARAGIGWFGAVGLTYDNSLQSDLDKYRERLGEAEKRISRMEWLEDERHDNEKTTVTDQRREEIMKQPAVPKQKNTELHNYREGLQAHTGEVGDSENSLEAFLKNLLHETKGCRAAVFADDQGLLVAGVGEYEENLAVIAAVCDEAGDKIIDILPLGKPQEIRMVDENGLTVTVYSVSIGAQWLTLVLLSVGDDIEREAVKRLIRTHYR